METNPDRDLLEEFKQVEKVQGRLGKGDGSGKYAQLTPDKVRRNVIKYFQYLRDNDRFATITGLALYAGFKNRKQLIEYEARPGFNQIIDAAKALIEYSYEVRLKMPEVRQSGIIFALNQLGWENKQVIENTGGTDAELAQLLDKVPEKKLRAIKDILENVNKT